MTAPILLYLLVGTRFCASIFYGDDFDLLETLTFAPEAESWKEKFRLWTKQQNEHRIVFPRLIAFLCYKAEGIINWQTICLVANLIWVGIVYFLWKAFDALKLPIWLFTPVPFILFQPQYFENIIWPISILQQSNVLFWLAFAIFLYAKGRYKALLIPAFIAIFTHGNGLSILPVIALLIILEKKWSVLKIWIPFSLLSVFLVFYGLQSGQGAQIGESLSNPLQLITAFFTFLGGVTRVLLEDFLWSAIMGFLLVALLCWALLPPTMRAIQSRGTSLSFFEKFLIGIVAVLLISAALVSISRSWAGLASILPPRYLQNTALFACLAYLAVLKILPTKRAAQIIGGISVVLAIAFNVLSYFVNFSALENHRFNQAAEETNYLHHGFFPQYHWTFNRNIKERYEAALNKGVVQMKSRLPEISGEHPIDSSAHLRFTLDLQPPKGEPSPRKPGILWCHADKLSKEQTYLYLQPASGNGYWILLKKTRAAFIEMFIHGYLSGRSLNGMVLYENLPLGEYTVGMLADDRFSWTGQKLTIENERMSVK
jgi:hypothetical protein